MTCSPSDLVNAIEDGIASAHASGVQAERKRIVEWLQSKNKLCGGRCKTTGECPDNPTCEDLERLATELERAEG
jgi:hypothetical protein